VAWQWQVRCTDSRFHAAFFIQCLKSGQFLSLHHALNDLVARCFASAGTPVTKEPTGLFHTDGKRLDGLTLVPWQSGKSLCWDETVICPLAESYVTGSAREAGAAAELTASRKEEKILEANTCLRPSRLKPWDQ